MLLIYYIHIDEIIIVRFHFYKAGNQLVVKITFSSKKIPSTYFNN